MSPYQYSSYNSGKRGTSGARPSESGGKRTTLTRKRNYNQQGKYRGVRKRGASSFIAEIKDTSSGVRKWLGTFPSAEEAARAFDEAAFEIRGSTAKLNFPREYIKGRGGVLGSNPPKLLGSAATTKMETAGMEAGNIAGSSNGLGALEKKDSFEQVGKGVSISSGAQGALKGKEVECVEDADERQLVGVDKQIKSWLGEGTSRAMGTVAAGTGGDLGTVGSALVGEAAGGGDGGMCLVTKASEISVLSGPPAVSLRIGPPAESLRSGPVYSPDFESTKKPAYSPDRSSNVSSRSSEKTAPVSSAPSACACFVHSILPATSTPSTSADVLHPTLPPSTAPSISTSFLDSTLPAASAPSTCIDVLHPTLPLSTAPSTSATLIHSSRRPAGWECSVDVSGTVMMPGGDGSLQEAEDIVELPSIIAGPASTMLTSWHAEMMMQYAPAIVPPFEPHSRRHDHGMRKEKAAAWCASADLPGAPCPMEERREQQTPGSYTSDLENSYTANRIFSPSLSDTVIEPRQKPHSEPSPVMFQSHSVSSPVELRVASSSIPESQPSVGNTGRVGDAV
ncbi:unnamed protein product [Closterium sp. Yama58-4]|nr:unnamed protein product [Closterium sp. Yama58-4]